MALYWSQWKPAFYNADCIRWLRDDWKCTVVRPSMAVNADGYLVNPQQEMQKVKTVIQAAVDLGIYVIVDFHETEDGPAHVNQAKTFFGEISKTYGHLPNIIYETWNEPLNTHAWATVIKPYHEAVIATIRANDPDNIILCGTQTWSQDVDVASRSPITSSANIAYTLHFYAATHKAELRAKAATALNNGIALMVTEGGLSAASGGDALDTAEGRRWCDFLDQNGITWTNWSICDVPESSAALKVGTQANGNWNAGQLTPSGTWVRNRIRSHNGIASTTILAHGRARHRTAAAMRRLGPGMAYFPAAAGGAPAVSILGRRQGAVLRILPVTPEAGAIKN